MVVFPCGVTQVTAVYFVRVRPQAGPGPFFSPGSQFAQALSMSERRHFLALVLRFESHLGAIVAMQLSPGHTVAWQKC